MQSGDNKDAKPDTGTPGAGHAPAAGAMAATIEKHRLLDPVDAAQVFRASETRDGNLQ